MFKSKEDFLSLLFRVKQTAPNQFMACCPAHNDSNPSLSIKFDNGKILIHCFAGCSYSEIINSLHLRSKDLRYRWE